MILIGKFCSELEIWLHKLVFQQLKVLKKSIIYSLK